MKGFPLHQLDAGRIHAHLSHFMDRLSGIGDMKASNKVHSVINLGIEGFQDSGMRESKINPSTIPGLKPGACSGLILSGAFYPALKAGVWRRRSINLSKFPNPSSLNMRVSYTTASPFIMASI
jgi:hypothetical protein